jgi:tetratricopeptide (TPR) repeat protein
VEEPPEEDESLIPKECLMNPLEAQTDINTGDYYFKKSKWGAAANRYRDATCWDPGSADAYLKLGEADEKLHNFDGARDAYQKYLTLSPTGKNVANVKKRLAKLPPAKH